MASRGCAGAVAVLEEQCRPLCQIRPSRTNVARWQQCGPRCGRIRAKSEEGRGGEAEKRGELALSSDRSPNPAPNSRPQPISTFGTLPQPHQKPEHLWGWRAAECAHSRPQPSTSGRRRRVRAEMRVKPGGLSPHKAPAAAAGGSAAALRDGPTSRQLPLSLLLGLEQQPALLPTGAPQLLPLPSAPAPPAAAAAPQLPPLPSTPAPPAAAAAPQLPPLPSAPAVAAAATAGPATPAALTHAAGASSKRAAADALLAAALSATQHLIPSLPEAADPEHQQPRRHWRSSLQQQRPAGGLGPAGAAAPWADDGNGDPATRRRSSLRSSNKAAGMARLQPRDAAAQGGGAKRVRFESAPAGRAAGWQLVGRNVILLQQPPTPALRVVR